MEDIFKALPYSLAKNEKEAFYNQRIHELNLLHAENCAEYKRILISLNYDFDRISHFHESPFLPVRLFKYYDLLSVPRKSIVKTLTSSGTSGQAVSKIFLDKQTAMLQTKALSNIVSSIIGKKRAPMLIIDEPNVITNRNNFSARGAGILGFSLFGTKREYALDEQMELRIEAIQAFLQKHEGSRIFLFGFTFMIFQHFLRALEDLNINLDLSDGVLIHGGGWKKLIDQKIDSSQFRKRLYNCCGINSVFDYYGMVEQTGSIHMECEEGFLHAPVYGDVIVRRPSDFSCAELGETGILQTLSLLPLSYPGHSLLTEDEGFIVGEDDCKCGRLGKYFKIIGRLKSAEVRGCSDTYETRS